MKLTHERMAEDAEKRITSKLQLILSGYMEQTYPQPMIFLLSPVPRENRDRAKREIRPKAAEHA